MADKAILIQNLSKSYGDYKAVEKLSFEINNGECFGFLGPNGAGKTTTMKILYGKSNQDSCSETKIDIFGHDPQKDALIIKSFSGIVPQEDNLDTALNVTDNLILYSKFYGMPKEVTKKRILELLEFMELSDKGKSKVGELSGGMKRRLTIARALLNNPKLLILNESTTGLDPQVRHLIPLTHVVRLARAFCVPGLMKASLLLDLLYCIIFILVTGWFTMRGLKKRMIV